MVTKTYTVKGMHCSGCVQQVQEALRATPGVIEAQVQLDEPQAIVSLEHEIPLNELQQELDRKGHYRLSPWGSPSQEGTASGSAGQTRSRRWFGKKDCCS